jgi:uncharacterized protein with ATP-grasp and redox domains
MVNNKALEYYKKYEMSVKEDKNDWQKAMRLAIAGNIIDFGPTHNFDIEKKIEEVLEAYFPIDDSEKLFEEIKNAKAVIIAADTKIDLSRFDGKKLIKAKVADGINRPQELIERVLSSDAKIYHSSNKSQNSDSDEKEN